MTVVKIWWRHDGDTIRAWNEDMVWMTEQFGLPGLLWSANVTTDYMEISFTHEIDATLARLKLGTRW
jgi:hypothetical protein